MRFTERLAFHQIVDFHGITDPGSAALFIESAAEMQRRKPAEEAVDGSNSIPSGPVQYADFCYCATLMVDARGEVVVEVEVEVVFRPPPRRSHWFFLAAGIKKP